MEVFLNKIWVYTQQLQKRFFFKGRLCTPERNASLAYRLILMLNRSTPSHLVAPLKPPESKQFTNRTQGINEQPNEKKETPKCHATTTQP